ncbi:MAG: hypothetical protein QGI52_00900, partial [Alphaproteobacteria bacterium]|nr:hypothetical protein [Alphaproteobacteria bacterium]
MPSTPNVPSSPAIKNIERIIFATELGYMPHRVGGAQTSMHELNLQLMARGVEVAVLCSGEPGQAADNVRRDEYGGYRVYRTRRPDKAVEAVCRDFQPHAAV